MEFVQFHPTALDHQSAPRFLVSEALRGEGAHLLDCDHERFMLGVHPLAELAPRDVVSREIERVMSRCGRTNVWLDARHLGDAYLRSRFPSIWQACLDAGYDLAHDLVPVAPAAHYLIGGVRVDVDGQTSLEGLYATGECAASGLHGANRLASNSLLEGLVFSRRVARALSQERLRPRLGRHRAPETEARASIGADAALVALRSAAQRSLGMSRTADGTEEAFARLAETAAALGDPRSVEEFEATNLLTVGGLIARAARMRNESRGCHSRMDYPERDDAHWLRHSVWRRGAEPRLLPVESAAD